jgi:Glucodextranase, domain B
MRSPRSRAKALVVAVVLAMVALPVASASAIVETSQITSPAGLSFPFVQESTKLTIEGTATGLTEVDLRCYYGTGTTSYNTLESEVPVNGGGTFKTEVLASRLPDEVCQLRAVPHGSSLALPPGEKEEFEGPTVVTSAFIQEATNYYAYSSTLAGSFDFQSAGNFALESSLYSASAHEDVELFYGEVDLEAFPPIGSRSTVQVDGANAYVPEAASEVNNELREEAESHAETFVPPSGKPAVTVHSHFEESTHQIKLEEEDPVVKCSPAATFPPTVASCTSFVATGVKVDRIWVSSDEDHLASMTETWVSTDGAAHTVNVRYFNEMSAVEKGATYQFPGEAGFSPTTTGASKTLPAGAGTILYKTAPSLTELGNGADPQGAIVYDTAPSEPIKFTLGSSGGTSSRFEAPYQRSIPAGGSSTLRMSFVQGFGLPEVRSLAATALASYYPTVAITSPANATTVATPAVTVTGTASDSGALSSLTVNGATVAVGAGGAWSTSVALKPGANTITATATDQAGLSSSSAITVTYTVPKPPAPTASQVGSASGSKGQVTLTLACHGTAGTSCKVHESLTTIEKLRHGHLVAVVAVKTHSKQVTVASLTVAIPAGEQIKVSLKLNATGRKLLARFGKLPAHLTAILEGEGGHHTIVAQNITIKPKPKKHKH